MNSVKVICKLNTASKQEVKTLEVKEFGIKGIKMNTEIEKIEFFKKKNNDVDSDRNISVAGTKIFVNKYVFKHR